MSLLKVTLVDKMGSCITCNKKEDEESDEDVNEVPTSFGRRKRKDTNAELVTVIEEGTDITTVHTKYEDYDNLIDTELCKDHDIILLSKEGVLLFFSGPRVKRFAICEVGHNLFERWKEKRLNIFIAIFEGILEKKKPQIEIILNPENHKLRICGTFSLNKSEVIDLVTIVVKPSVTSIEDVKKMIAV